MVSGLWFLVSGLRFELLSLSAIMFWVLSSKPLNPEPLNPEPNLLSDNFFYGDAIGKNTLSPCQLLNGGGVVRDGTRKTAACHGK